MDFDFSDEQEQLRDAVRKWVERGYDFARRRAIVKAGGFSAEAWAELAGLGLTGLAIAEDHGGMGDTTLGGPVAAMVAMEELGRGLVLEPLAAVALVAPQLLSAGRSPANTLWLHGIATGEEIVVLAHQERAARYRLSHVTTRAVREGDAWLLTGHKSVVPAGGVANAFLVPARVSGSDDDAGGIALFTVPARQAGVRTHAYRQQDGAAAAELALEGARGEELIGTGDAFVALQTAVDVGIAALCAEAVGAMDALMKLTVDYMNTRKQFGVPIASFQALRHRVADMKMQLELARSMSYYATLKLGEPADARRRALSQAKVQIGQSLRVVGQQAVQLHGGIGVTDEYIGSHYFKRLTCIELAFGDTLHHLGEVSARMTDTAGVFA